MDFRAVSGFLADNDVVSLYADPDDGTWQIDNAVLNLVVAGEPESDLPDNHPAVEALDDLRTQLQSEYVEYLEDLGDLVTETVEAGAPFVEEDHSYQFFTKKSDSLESGQTVALFVIDALRLDLARRLAKYALNRTTAETEGALAGEPSSAALADSFSSRFSLFDDAGVKERFEWQLGELTAIESELRSMLELVA